MEHAVPCAVRLEMIEHDGRVWPSVAHLTFRELACHASPNVSSTLFLQELAALDGIEGQDVLLHMTGIALEDIVGVNIGTYLAACTACISPLPFSMTQLA